MRSLVAIAFACGVLATSVAKAEIFEVNVADFVGTVEQAFLDEDDFGTLNPGNADGAFTSWVENDVTITPFDGQLGFYSGGNAIGLRFAADANGYGNGTAVLTFDVLQSYLGIEVGFGQGEIGVALYEDAEGLLPLGDIILTTPESSPNLFALYSDLAFLRADVRDVNALGEIQNSNQISDLRFVAVPEPEAIYAFALAAAALTWLRRSR